jgi:hypothetical protein
MNVERGSIWIFGGGVVLLIALSIAGPLFLERWFAEKKSEKKDSSLALLTPPERRPWIEITNAHIFLLKNEGDEKTLLTNGDELEAGARIVSDATGRAIVHFADGSLARVGADTEFILETGSYDESKKTLTVAMQLVNGRIWSRIIELATPASLWEIKTANAVAVVRGTAFGIEYKNGISRVIGSENKVTVIPIDPKTNKRLEEAAVIITPGTFVEVTKDGASPIRNTPQEIKEDDWIKEAQENTKQQAAPEAKRPVITPNPVTRVPAEKLTIEMALQTKTMREGEAKTLHATALMSDGTKRDVSDRVTWRVIGAIGTLSSDGVFTPKLIGTQAEFGSAIGSIVAIFKTEDGKELVATTPTFEVKASFEDTNDLDLRG